MEPRINSLLKNPPIIKIHDVNSNSTRQTFVIIAGAPKYIITICEKNSLTKSDHKILAEYYGKDYMKKLAMEISGGDCGSEKSFVQQCEPPENREVFTHFGNKYDLNCAMSVAAGRPIVDVNVAEIDWILIEIPQDYFNNFESADLSEPILIVQSGGIQYVIDGKHRLKKAAMLNIAKLPARIIDDVALNSCFIPAEYKIAGDDFDDIQQLLQEKPKKSKVTTAHFDGGITYVTNVQIFPEDNFITVREKIYIITGIPPYRIYFVDRITHDIYANINVDTNIYNKYNDEIFGIGIDKELYNNRHSIHIDALDTFIIVGDTLQISIVDLGQFVKSPNPEILANNYVADLVYYGFVIKYWPILTRECFREYLISETSLIESYPELARPANMLLSMYKSEANLINSHYAAQLKAHSVDTKVAITQMTIKVNNGGTIINVRNLFDKLRVGRCIPEIHGYVKHDGHNYMLRKIHINNGSDIVFPPAQVLKHGVTIAISLRSLDQDTYHHKKSISTQESEQARYMFLNVREDGNYYIRAMWNEEDEANFSNIIKLTKKFICPVITKINAMGKYVFVTGQSLPMLSQYNMTFVGVNASIFWKKVITTNSFKVLKSMFDPYMQSGITAPVESRSQDKYELIFKKGIYEFDPDVINNVVAMSNQYLYLSEQSIRQKWQQLYSGRHLRISNRTADVRFEIFDIKNNEFSIFYSYILSFAYRAANDSRITAQIQITEGSKKLRRLREMDPELYNLKKYGSPHVYSKLCQNPHQPSAYTDEEVKKMSPQSRNKLIKYWNFTLNKPAYYGCSNKIFPHLSFMAGVHPKNYCLPCCNKKEQTMGVRKDIYDECLLKHKFSEEIETDSMRHIMSYGKDIEGKRLSKIPHLLEKHLGANNLTYNLCGVQQNISNLTNIGSLFAIVEALQITADEFIDSIIANMSRNKSIFESAAGGQLHDYYGCLDNFVAEVRGIFSRSLTISRFSYWNELFIEQACNLYDLSIYVFIDIDRKGEYIELYSKSQTISAKNLLLMKCKNRYYPIFLLSADSYFRSDDVKYRLFAADSTIMKVVEKLLIRHSDSSQISHINLAVVEKFANDRGHVIKNIVINLRNRCYAVILQYKNTDIFLPIYESQYKSGIKLRFETIAADDSAPIDIVQQLLVELSDYSSILINIEKIVESAGHILGKLNTGVLIPLIAPTIQVDEIIPYNIFDVNKSIQKREKPVVDGREYVNKIIYENNLYKLFVMEFAAYCDGERNADARKALIDTINATNFKQSADKFNNLLHTFAQKDRDILLSQLRIYSAHLSKGQFIDMINNTIYDFDSITLAELSKLSGDKLREKLAEISAKFAIEGQIDDPSIDNMYIACRDIESKHCRGQKLVVKNMRDMVDLLAADLENPIKRQYLLNDIYLQSVLQYFAFEKIAAERILIYKF